MASGMTTCAGKGMEPAQNTDYAKGSSKRKMGKTSKEEAGEPIRSAAATQREEAAEGE